MTTAKEQRLNAILDFIEQAGQGGVTRLQIARSQGMKKSPYLNSLLAFLLEHDYIIQTVDFAPNGAPMYRYHPAAR